MYEAHKILEGQKSQMSFRLLYKKYYYRINEPFSSHSSTPHIVYFTRLIYYIGSYYTFIKYLLIQDVYTYIIYAYFTRPVRM